MYFTAVKPALYIAIILLNGIIDEVVDECVCALGGNSFNFSTIRQKGQNV